MSKSDYEIGYGKPPKKSRFKEGESGNLNGRPKGKGNIATVLNTILNEKVVINENGRKRHVTKLVASIKQVVNRAITGDLASMRLLMQLTSANAELAKEAPALFNAADDMQLLTQLVERTKHTGLNSEDDTVPQPLKEDDKQ